jgi:hypothetical protein
LGEITVLAVVAMGAMALILARHPDDDADEPTSSTAGSEDLGRSR